MESSDMFAALGTQEILVLCVVFLVWFVCVTVFYVLPNWLICKKAGLSPWISLLSYVPFGSILISVLLAALPWPALEKKSNESAPLPPLPVIHQPD